MPPCLIIVLIRLCIAASSVTTAAMRSTLSVRCVHLCDERVELLLRRSRAGRGVRVRRCRPRALRPIDYREILRSRDRNNSLRVQPVRL